MHRPPFYAIELTIDTTWKVSTGTAMFVLQSVVFTTGSNKHLLIMALPTYRVSALKFYALFRNENKTKKKMTF